MPGNKIGIRPFMGSGKTGKIFFSFLSLCQVKTARQATFTMGSRKKLSDHVLVVFVAAEPGAFWRKKEPCHVIRFL